MKRKDLDKFEKLKAQLDSLYQEMSVLAKKSPNDAVNAFKIEFINLTLHACNDFFGKTYLPFPNFALFSTDELPTNSDVTFMLSQYIECAEKLRSDNIMEEEFGGDWYWCIQGDGEKVQTAPPKKLTRK
jgi:hypothetical protein